MKLSILFILSTPLIWPLAAQEAKTGSQCENSNLVTQIERAKDFTTAKFEPEIDAVLISEGDSATIDDPLLQSKILTARLNSKNKEIPKVSRLIPPMITIPGSIDPFLPSSNIKLLWVNPGRGSLSPVEIHTPAIRKTADSTQIAVQPSNALFRNYEYILAVKVWDKKDGKFKVYAKAFVTAVEDAIPVSIRIENLIEEQPIEAKLFGAEMTEQVQNVAKLLSENSELDLKLGLHPVSEMLKTEIKFNENLKPENLKVIMFGNDEDLLLKDRDLKVSKGSTDNRLIVETTRPLHKDTIYTILFQVGDSTGPTYFRQMRTKN